jgi:UDP-3-O-[3-hydroxymyristoyl] N-acetylglucosamine deacetylase
MGALHGLQSNADGARWGAVPSADPAAADETGRQHTLKTAIHCSGTGLHSGAKIAMTLIPAGPDTGIRFRRSDLPGTPEIAASWRNAVETPLCTTMAAGSVKVATVEHLMSALAASGIDNAVVELDGPEVPIMDGSAAPFVFLVECAGTLEQPAARQAIRVLKTVTIADGARRVTLSPAARFGIDFDIDFDSEVVARQTWSGGITRQRFKSDLARARTFGFLQEVDHLRRNGLAQGGSLDNAVVIDGDGVMNEGGLRFADEFVRHKVLDVIGDLYLAGGPIVGHFQGVRSGHAMNLQALKALFADREAWCRVDLRDAATAGASVPPARAVAARA